MGGSLFRVLYLTGQNFGLFIITSKLECWVFSVYFLLLCIASCTQNADLVVHKEGIKHGDLTVEKAVVNRTVPVQVTYTIQANQLKADSVSWLHNNEHIKIDDKTNQEVYYTIETLDDSIVIGLHFRLPTARVTGNWTLIVTTADSQEHRAVCFVECKYNFFLVLVSRSFSPFCLRG
ncbi:hypothetical protein FBUS_11217 [Fasciolopsis buskii]|uniref:Uncharacterized protein n=1 Tax=Fasciolopsis buskii TaxID=27845 RepID=A0A8E0VF71_9TREM|nr:hypothetical protein FBUS_11217 [Fasciolopsis buski]